MMKLLGNLPDHVVGVSASVQVNAVANATRMFACLLPGLVKVFSNDEQSDARTWIAA